MFLHRSELKGTVLLRWRVILLLLSSPVASIQLPIAAYLNPRIFKSRLFNKSFELQFHAFERDLNESSVTRVRRKRAVCAVLKMCNAMTVTITVSTPKCSALQYRTLIMW